MSKFLFNDDEEFKLMLGDTFAYKNMQNVISKLVSFTNPTYLIEFGSGSGATSIRLAKENPQTSIVAVDFREEMVDLSTDKIKKGRISNVTFVNGDLTKLKNYNLKNANVILLFYSFKYIEDPIENKYMFLKSIYSRMQKGAYLIIGDTFIEEGASKQDVKKQLESIFYNNGQDSYWGALTSLDDEVVKKATEVKLKIRELAKEHIESGANRAGVYYVSRSWMRNSATEIGFKILISERLNNLQDEVMVLTK